MKVNELFETTLEEAYTPPVRNKKLGFSNKGEKVPTGKQGIPTGGTKEWLKSFGATSTDVDQALRTVRQSAAYRAVKAAGMVDESTDRHNTLGSMTFVGYIECIHNGRLVKKRMKVTVQANGKIDETSIDDYHRAPMTSLKPRIVPGDAVQSIVKTMSASLEKVASTVERRKAQAKAEIKKVLKKGEDTYEGR